MIKEHLKVYARLKPFDQEVEPLPYLDLTKTSIELQLSRAKLSNAKDNHIFEFDEIFPQNSKQENIFEEVAKPVIDNCLEGYNGTIFAYGQTGSGKTFTMSGGDHWPDRGIIPRVISYIFSQFENRSQKFTYELFISFIEIYNENAYDLLEPKHNDSNLDQWSKIKCLQSEQSSLQMKNLTAHQVENENEALYLLCSGSELKKINSTCINQASSRSHCIFTLNVRAKNKESGNQLESKIHLVDLAGSQRVSKSQAQGIVLTEAKSINLSLTYLEQVIVSLNQKKKNKGKNSHIPYRNSLLTTILKDSLGGNCKTVMIATISMDRSNQDETISTLRFAQRVKLIENQINKNEKNVFSNKIEKLERQNALLKKRLAKLEQKQSYVENQEEEEVKLQKYMNNQIEDLQIQNIPQAKNYLKKMKNSYNEKLSQYFQELTYISQKLAKYDEIVNAKQRKRMV